MTIDTEELRLISRREAIRRVSALLGGVAFIGGTSLISACEKAPATVEGTPGKFTPEDIAYLDEVAETILPATKTPGAKAAKTGAFMALMVTDSYGPDDQKIFREGMTKLEEATKKAHNVGFMAATPQQRLDVLNVLDREQKTFTDARENAQRQKRGLPPIPAGGTTPGAEHLPDQRKEAGTGGESSGAAAITADAPSHYFRMMKELALLGYFTSEIGYTKAMRYIESPGRFDPCVPYVAGEPQWAPHA